MAGFSSLQYPFSKAERCHKLSLNRAWWQTFHLGTEWLPAIPGYGDTGF